MLFDFDNEKKLAEIKEDFSNLVKLNDSIADHRSSYREFANHINLDFHVLDDCIKRYENVLLISCYTFSEQITKGLIYQLLEKDSNINPYVNSFINKKIHPEKFSPNVKINNLVSLIKELKQDFKFILNKHSDLIKYDEMVNCRHLYAHANNYTFQFDQYEAVINVLDYLNFEFVVLSYDEELRDEVKIQIENLSFLSKKLSEATDKSFRNPKINEIYENCQNLKELFTEKSIEVILFNNILNKTNYLLEIDKTEDNCEQIYKAVKEIYEQFI